MTAASALPCPSCKRPLEAHAWRDETGGGCTRCRADFDFIGFPALRTERARLAPRAAAAAEDSVCFYHPENRADAVCEDCGRFLCTVCTLEFTGRHVCPSCISVAKRAEAEPTVRTRTIYDRLALLLALAPLLVWPLTLVTAPVTIGMVLYGWKKPGSLVLGRSRTRLVLAAIIGALQIGGWASLGISWWLRS